ncbi:MAG: hypothetical protein R3B96_09050 [Pirellulaceae bacterium]
MKRADPNDDSRRGANQFRKDELNELVNDDPDAAVMLKQWIGDAA